MKDSHQLMMKFAKVVERHPEIYDHNMEAYKTRQVESAWEKVANSVRLELKEECSVEELKTKWKGIRSSYTRYKNKVLTSGEASFKKYYLYDTLRFLDPFIKLKGLQHKENSFGDISIYDEEVSNENNSSEDWSIPEPKPDISNKDILITMDPLNNQAISSTESISYEKSRKRKYSNEEKSVEDDNEDLQFFKSILPDIKHFTNKEKRKLKMGVLQLIDDLENERKQE